MYHVAPEDRLSPISQHGLRAGEPVWDNAEDWNPVVYLWDTEEAAQIYGLETFQRGRDQSYDLYRVQIRGLDLQPDQSDFDSQGQARQVAGAWITKSVPPMLLERWTPSGYEAVN